MKTKIDNPGVKIPPPLFYVVTFLLSVLLQKLFFIDHFIFKSLPFEIAAVVLILISLIFIIPALRQFFKTKNTVITVKPATSLQISGVYSITRNPMYLGLLLLYGGLVFLAGNWWTIIFMPVLIIAVTLLIVLPEERYLQREFGETYSLYKEKVRRWL
jgi:protein-S-isoprenylcysteine O-methyltransferase Ste14